MIANISTSAHELGVRNSWPFRDLKMVDVDTNIARYFTTPWKRLSEFEKRKFENLVVLIHSVVGEGRVKVLFTDNGRTIAETA